MKDGTVFQVQVIGCTNPDHGFEAAASDAVLKWLYEPGTVDGKPVEVWVTVLVEFTLEKTGTEA
jgi:outer membrane biosynthesis protein TonB